MASIKRKYNTKEILDNIYPKISEALKKYEKDWKKCLSMFITNRSDSLFDTLPCDRIYYTDHDRDALFNGLKLNRRELLQFLHKTYYWDINPFKPSQAKDISSVVFLCIVRYFFMKNDVKSLELAMVYLTFSGKFYPSIHYGSFPTVAPSKYRHVMEYVLTHKMSMKYGLKSQGSVIGAIKDLNQTWISAYKDQMKSFYDEEAVYLIQQLHNRLKSFMKNVAVLYYESYENKEYISFTKDDLGDADGNNFHLADNDSFRLQKFVENTMTRINTSQVDLKACRAAEDGNVKKAEISAIIETIIHNQDNMNSVKELITLMIANYFAENEERDVVSIKFLSHSIKPKPNTKDPALIRMKEIIGQLLDDNSVGYRKRKNRTATKLSYHRSLLIYLAMTIINANKK